MIFVAFESFFGILIAITQKTQLSFLCYGNQNGEKIKLIKNTLKRGDKRLWGDKGQKDG